jgi:protocatechuate 3,4-dioxygenase beta subunit
VAGGNARQQSVRTDVYGVFEFEPVPGGTYVVTAARRAFMPFEYGQKNWRAAGTPIVLEEAASTFLNVRLQRYGAITGQVLDENDAGLPQHEVVAYRNTRPPQLVTRVKADERGIFRIFGLDPGSYLVRNVGKDYDGDAYLPAFAPESANIEQARAVEVYPGEDSTGITVRPLLGALLSVSGTIGAPIPFSLTLASDMGRQTVRTSGEFNFPALAPGQYELYGETTDGDWGFYTALALERESKPMHMNLAAVRPMDFNFVDNKGGFIDPRDMQVLVRRKDLAGEGEPRRLRLRGRSATLPTGRWELMLIPPAKYCVVDFFGPRGTRAEGPHGDRTRSDGWNEVLVGTGYHGIRFVLSPHPASVHGFVKSGSDAIVGAPVYLEAWDARTHERLLRPRSTRTDLQGRYEFSGLAPGTYRVLSTFEFRNPEAADFDKALARDVKLNEDDDLAQDLDLYLVR